MKVLIAASGSKRDILSALTHICDQLYLEKYDAGKETDVFMWNGKSGKYKTKIANVTVLDDSD